MSNDEWTEIHFSDIKVGDVVKRVTYYVEDPDAEATLSGRVEAGPSGNNFRHVSLVGYGPTAACLGDIAGRRVVWFRRVPSLPTAPNSIIVDVVLHGSSMQYPLARLGTGGRWNVYTHAGSVSLCTLPGGIQRWTEARVEPVQ